MFFKIHFLYSHFSFFSENLRAASDKQGKRFKQDIQVIEKRYQRVWSEGKVIFAGCCTVMIQPIPQMEIACETVLNVHL